MRLQDKIAELIGAVPRPLLFLAIPIVAFALATAVTFGLSGGDDDDDESADAGDGVAITSPTAGPDNLDVPPTVTPEPTQESTEADPENRENCDAIRGTDYLSPLEREWYLDNCVPPQDVAQSGDGGEGNSGGGGGGSGGFVSGSEYAMGDRIVIPSIGVDASVNGAVVPASGRMPDPAGYFYALWYDFQNHSGIGGYTDGNLVLAAHVDCAACHNGGPGLALFSGVSGLQSGATARYVSGDGTVHEYVVRSVAAYSPSANWGSLLATSNADMTLITCGGEWDAARGEYTTRWAAFLDKVG